MLSVQMVPLLLSLNIKEIKDVDYKTGNVLAQVDKKTDTWVTPKGLEISEEEALKERVKQEATQE